MENNIKKSAYANRLEYAADFVLRMERIRGEEISLATLAIIAKKHEVSESDLQDFLIKITKNNFTL
jgi:hypothetical protein